MQNSRLASIFVLAALTAFSSCKSSPVQSYADNLVKAPVAADETAAIRALRAINTAQVAYLTAYPNAGFACSLEKLGPPSDGSPSPDRAGLLDSALAAGTKSGYSFSIFPCQDSPAKSYLAIATPLPGAVARVFCTDESAVIRSAPPGETCTADSPPIP